MSDNHQKKLKAEEEKIEQIKEAISPERDWEIKRLNDNIRRLPICKNKKIGRPITIIARTEAKMPFHPDTIVRIKAFFKISLIESLIVEAIRNAKKAEASTINPTIRVIIIRTDFFICLSLFLNTK